MKKTPIIRRKDDEFFIKNNFHFKKEVIMKKTPIIRRKDDEFFIENNFHFKKEYPIYHDPITFDPILTLSFTISPTCFNDMSDDEYYELMGEKLKQDYINAAKNNLIENNSYNNELFENLDENNKEMLSNLFDYILWYLKVNNKYYKVYELLFVIFLRIYKNKNSYNLSDVNQIIKDIYNKYCNYIKGFNTINDFDTVFVELYLDTYENKNN